MLVKRTRIDPDARLDYQFDYTAPAQGRPLPFLEDGETIASYTLTATDITVENDSETDGVVTFWVKDGVVRKVATVTCHVVTSAGREDDAVLKLEVAQP